MLQDQLRAAGVEYQLWPGGELRIAEETLDWMQQYGIPTLGTSRNVLVDYWGNHWPTFADTVIERLLEQGYQPILAHPERMDLDDREWEAVLRRLEHISIRFQGNLRCLAGREGPRVAERASRLLREDRYKVLATDMHGVPDLGDRLAGISAVVEQVGAVKFRDLLVDAPHEIIAPTK
jgi:protein-tyrosine phosphatase